MQVHGLDNDYQVIEHPKQDDEPKIEAVNLGDLYLRSMYFEKPGDSNVPHMHTYPHYTLLASGSCSGEIDGEIELYVAPTIIFTPAEVMHKFTALEPNTALHCINILHEGVPMLTRKKAKKF